MGVVISPSSDLQGIADYVEAHQETVQTGALSPRYTARPRQRSAPPISRWTSSSTPATLADAPTLPGPRADLSTVLLTVATGYLGRYLLLDLLDWVRRRAASSSVWSARRRSGRAGGWMRCSTVATPSCWTTTGAGRRPSRGHRRRQGRARPRIGQTELATPGRHRGPDRRSRGSGQRYAALPSAVRAQRGRHGGAYPPGPDRPAGNPSPSCPRSVSAVTAIAPGSSPRTLTSGRSVPTRPSALLRERLRQQQMGGRSVAPRSPRPVWAARSGVPLRHDHGRTRLSRAAQCSRHGHPADLERCGDRPGAGIVLCARDAEATGLDRISTVSPSISSPTRSRRLSVTADKRVSRLFTC